MRQATKARDFAGGAGGEADRRVDYVPPAERGPVYGGAAVPGRGGVAQYVVVTGGRTRWELWIAALGLLLYIGISGRQWWRLFRAKVWLS